MKKITVISGRSSKDKSEFIRWIIQAGASENKPLLSIPNHKSKPVILIDTEKKGGDK